MDRGIKITIFLILLAGLVVGAIFYFDSKQPTKNQSEDYIENITPKPVSVSIHEDYFELDDTVSLSSTETNEKVTSVLSLFKDDLQKQTGITLSDELTDKTITFSITNEKTENQEGYSIDVTPDGIQITSPSANGLFYATRTLLQLMPQKPQDTTIQIAAVSIVDYPRYEWRGSMLDVSRHFFSVEDVKSYIDYLAMYKMNRLHLHLSDDQGWRIEIKSWPRLTEIGGSTEVGGGEGGFYTQEQYKDIVQYASIRGITIVPEIDMPGHTNAALASYGELNPDGQPKELYTDIEVGFSSLDLKSETTYQLVDDVVRELSEITPGSYIHIGGDETWSTDQDEYINFVNRTKKIVESYGKRMVGWEEIGFADVNENDIAQHWANPPRAQMAAEKGASIILSPSSRAYLDMKYDEKATFGQDWGGIINTETAYDWNPDTFLENVPTENIIGVEAPIWTEYIDNLNKLELMLFPRIVSIAELAWSSVETHNYSDFKKRLEYQKTIWDIKYINYYGQK